MGENMLIKDEYDELFISDEKEMFLKAERLLSKEFCPCGHSYSEHDKLLGGCKENSPNGRDRCVCLSWSGKSKMSALIEVVREDTRKKIAQLFRKSADEIEKSDRRSQ